MNGLKIADHLTLPIDAVTEKLAWLGRTGSGKTYGATKLAELMLDAGVQIVALDPVGVWRGLRVPSAKGGGAMAIYVFGGLYHDFPLEPSGGRLMADIIADRGISVVLDVSQWVDTEQQRFARDFAEHFFGRKKAAPSAVHLFMEESQEFLPQNPQREEAKTLHHFTRLWKLGRNFGIGGSLISQRPQEVNKKALNMSGTLFAFQMTGPQERKTVEDWISAQGINEDIRDILPTLIVGQPHAWSAAFGFSKTVRILPKLTADVSSSPKVIGGRAKEQPLSPIDVEKLSKEMAATIEKAKAEDPRELRKQVADLQRQLAGIKNIPVGRPNLPTPKRVDVLTDADRELLRKIGAGFEGMAMELGVRSGAFLAGLEDRLQQVVTAAMTKCHEEGEKVHEAGRRDFEKRLESKGFQKILGKLTAVAPVAPAQQLVPHPQRLAPRPRVTSAANNGDIASTEQRVLDAVAWWAAAGVDEPTRTQVAFVAKYTVNGHFNNIVGGLHSKELVDYPTGGGISLTDLGQRTASASQGTPTREELTQRVSDVLRSEPKQRIFWTVVQQNRVLSREELASLTNYTVNGHFNNLVGELHSIGVIEYPQKGGVRLARLFEALP